MVNFKKVHLFILKSTDPVRNYCLIILVCMGLLWSVISIVSSTFTFIMKEKYTACITRGDSKGAAQYGYYLNDSQIKQATRKGLKNRKPQKVVVDEETLKIIEKALEEKNSWWSW